MDIDFIKAAAQRADELARLEEDTAFQPAAFAVIFDRLLSGHLEADGSAASDRMRRTKTTSVRARDAKPGPLQRLRELAEDGFFKAPRSLKETLDELRRRGHSYDQAVAGKGLLRLVRERVLRRSRRKEGGREFYSYAEW